MGIKEMILFSLAEGLELSVFSFTIGTMISKNKLIPFLACILSFFQSLTPFIGFFSGNLLRSSLGDLSIVSAYVLIIIGILVITEKVAKKSANIISTISLWNLVFAVIGIGLQDLIASISLGIISNNPILFFIIFLSTTLLINSVALTLGRVTRKSFTLPVNYAAGILLICMGVINLKIV